MSEMNKDRYDEFELMGFDTGGNTSGEPPRADGLPEAEPSAFPMPDDDIIAGASKVPATAPAKPQKHKQQKPKRPAHGTAQPAASGEEARDYFPIRNRRDSRTGLLGGVMYAVFIISVSVILACMGWMFASDLLALNKPVAEAVVEIPRDFDIDDVADALKDAGIIEYKFLFKLYAGISSAEEKISPGSYTLSTVFDYRALVKKMQTGSTSQLVTTVTIPEGYTMEQIFRKLEDSNVCSVEDLEEAAANYNYTYSFVKDLEKGDPSRLEGFLFPDTYDFYEGEQASSVINKFLVNFYYKLTADMLKQAEALNMSVRDIVIVASMIEKEAGSAEERADIASVIYNRLNNNMLLQIDATVQYVLPEPKAYLTDEDTAIDSPYNTYLHSGLPAGPVSNPGLASIMAALRPNTTNYFYYALDTETGLHRFFATYEEHRAFTATQDYTNQ